MPPPRAKPSGLANFTSKLLNKKNPLFEVSFSPNYQSFFTRHIESDNNHPLCFARRRVARNRVQEGLWWNVTVTISSSNRSVIRTWLVRRLKTAFVESLKAKGISEDGTIQKTDPLKIKSSVILEMLEQGKPVAVTGSMKLHVSPSLLTAKGVEVKKETDLVVDALVKGLEISLQNNNRQLSGSRDNNNGRTQSPSEPQYSGSRQIVFKPSKPFSSILGQGQEAPKIRNPQAPIPVNTLPRLTFGTKQPRVNNFESP